MNIFYQPHFGDDKLLPGEMVGIARSQTESLEKTKELPPNNLCLAQMLTLPPDGQQFHGTWEYFIN